MTAWAWDVLTRRSPPTPRMLAELAQLRAALPCYDVVVTSHGTSYRYQAIRRHRGPGLWCLISTDAADLWRELAPCTRHGGLSRPC